MGSLLECVTSGPWSIHSQVTLLRQLVFWTHLVFFCRMLALRLSSKNMTEIHTHELALRVGASISHIDLKLNSFPLDRDHSNNWPCKRFCTHSWSMQTSAVPLGQRWGQYQHQKRRLAFAEPFLLSWNSRVWIGCMCSCNFIHTLSRYISLLRQVLSQSALSLMVVKGYSHFGCW